MLTSMQTIYSKQTSPVLLLFFNLVNRGAGHDFKRHACTCGEQLSIVLTGEGLFTDTSATYTLRLYATDGFFQVSLFPDVCIL